MKRIWCTLQKNAEIAVKNFVTIFLHNVCLNLVWLYSDKCYISVHSTEENVSCFQELIQYHFFGFYIGFYFQHYQMLSHFDLAFIFQSSVITFWFHIMCGWISFCVFHTSVMGGKPNGIAMVLWGGIFLAQTAFKACCNIDLISVRNI